MPRARAKTAGCCGSVLAEPLSERDASELASAFAALADPVRLRLLSLIAASDEVCSCDLEVPLARVRNRRSATTRRPFPKRD